MSRTLRTAFIVYALSALCQTSSGGAIYEVSLDTSSMVGHPAGPFYLYLALTDGSGVNDANNTVTLNNINFTGGSALGSPLLVGGAAGSLESGIAMTDSEFVSLFSEQFAPGLRLSFSLHLTSNDDEGGTPDRFTFFVLDSSGVPLPTLAPAGDYFFGVDLGSSGPVFDAWASDLSRSPSAGDPISVSAPTITAAGSVPEPSTGALVAGAIFVIALMRNRIRCPSINK